jgi:hypothetical protein
MPKRVLRVTKWLSMTPAVGVCTACRKAFKVPMAALSKNGHKGTKDILTQTKDAQINLQQQFDHHKCSSKPDSGNRARFAVSNPNLRSNNAVASSIRCTPRYAGRFGNDDLDNAGFAGDVATVADPHVSRRRLSRSSNAPQSWLIRAASFLGSISLLARSAMVRHSSEYGFMTASIFSRTHATLASRT